MRAIEAWGEVKRLQTFFADAETEANRLGPEERDRALARIANARLLSENKTRSERCSHGRVRMSDRQRISAGCVDNQRVSRSRA